MARYVFTYTKNGVCELYSESTPEEEKLDMVDDQIAVDFTGNGYLKFWTRCKQMIQDFELGETNDGSTNVVGIIEDLDYGTQKVVA